MSLEDLLRSVSRAFYLSLRVLPGPVRKPIATAYLLARAADTIADTRCIPASQRLDTLLAWRRQVCSGGPSLGRLDLPTESSGEKALLERLDEAVALLEELSPPDRAAVRGIVDTLIAGMEADLRHFPEGRLSALREPADLDRHTYYAAGCVGEFWTHVLMAHYPLSWNRARMTELGIRFGKALQLTNVLRDLPRDLAEGRCYLPSQELEAVGLTPETLLEDPQRLRPVLRRWLEIGLEHYRAALEYTLAIPGRYVRLRLSVLWPILIGLGTLELVASLERPRPVKVRRSQVYRLLLLSLPCAPFNFLVKRWVESALARAYSSSAGCRRPT